jgi:transcription initiation factor TFIID subunit 7
MSNVNQSASTSNTTTKKEKNEDQFELEQQFILRLPAVSTIDTIQAFICDLFKGDHAAKLRELVRSGDEKIRERLFIDLDPEERHAKVKFDDTEFKGTLYDLPCVTESYKTFDRKTMYKIADVAQVSLNTFETSRSWR